MALLEDDSVVALDGTGYFASKPRPCAACLHPVPRHGSRTYDHPMVGAASIHLDVRAVMPLMPAPLVQQEGTAQNDGARNTAKRCLGQFRQEHPHLQVIVTAASLRSNAPHIEPRRVPGLHYILGGKAGEHASLCPPGQAAAHSGRVPS